MATHTHHDPNVDKRAAFTGFTIAVLLLFTVVFTIVKLTNSHYAALKGHEAAATATH
jgi:hypothetical protein